MKIFDLSIGKRNFLFFVVLFILIISIFTCLWVLLNNANQLGKIHIRQYKSYQLEEELRRSSYEIAQIIQTYIGTGDIRFKNYFKTIEVIRNSKEPRPKAYQNIFWDFVMADYGYQSSTGSKVSTFTLMKEMHFSEDELNVLAKTRELAVKLIDMEIKAFNAMEGNFLGDDGKYSRKGKPNQKMARRIIRGKPYYQAKAEIMGKLNNFFHLLKTRTLNEVNIRKSKQEKLYTLVIILVIVLVFVSIFGFFYFTKKIISPLKDIRGKVKQMESGIYKFENSSRNDEIGLLMNAFVNMASNISKTIDKLKHLSRTDRLTKIANRIALDEALDKEKYMVDRYEGDCALILVDIDYFKAVNDDFGHIAGDQVLFEIANILKNSMRKSDTVGRWGGEEFLIICPKSNLKKARVVADHIRKKISDFKFTKVGHKTASFGTSVLKKNLTINVAIDKADKALYKAKENGRNKVY